MSLAAMENVLAEFGAAIGIPDLRPDEEHRCDLMIDDVAISFELGLDDETLCIYSLLGAVPEEAGAAGYRALLRANFMFQRTSGSTLSIDPRAGGIVLIRQERLESLRLARFESVVEDFVDVAERWMKRLESGELEAPPTAAQEDPPPSTEGMVRV